jgi:penicillin amidase
MTSRAVLHLFAFIAAALVGTGLAATQRMPERKLSGLQQPVEIIRDTWGVPHIYAQSQDDLFFAQGYTVAQDRMFQLEMWHRKAMGRLAEIFGPGAVERDRYARLLRYHGDMNSEWQSYSPDTKPIVEAFVRGINAYVEEVNAGREPLPPEFEILGIQPTPWTPEVVISRLAAYPMTGNADREIPRAEVVRVLGPERTATLFPTDPPRTPRPEEGLDLEGIDASVLAGLARASSETTFDGPADSLSSSEISNLGSQLSNLQSAIFNLQSAIEEGSNNWTVSGKKTKSGKPILSNDPHRALLLPSLRYIVHLVAPGWDVIGAGEPALPGVSIGHNQRIAFGLTIFAADQQDLVVERTHPANANEYFDPAANGWRAMEITEDEINVKGEAQPRRVQLKSTRNGPVIYEDAKRHRVYVLRWVGTEPGTAGYLAGLAISRAKNWREFRTALKRWKLPPENFVYADVDGNIGYQAAALVPHRQCDGLLPARGDARTCEWTGWLTLDDLPHEFNPLRGYSATANHNTLSPMEKRFIGFDWSSPFRINRIREVFKETKAFTVADSQKLQADVLSLVARELKPLFYRLPRGADRVGRAAELLRTWDCRMTQDSAAAPIFAAWLGRLRENTYRPHVPAEIWRSASRLISLPALIRILRAADAGFFPGDTAAERGKVLLTSLEEALNQLERLLGSDMTAWRWGALHTATFTHPLARMSESARAWNRGPVEKPGDGSTVNAAGGANFRHSSGASFRQVIDLGNWDASTATNVPGQSGNPRSANYDNLLPLWARDEHFPLVYTRTAVKRHARERVRLAPR